MFAVVMAGGSGTRFWPRSRKRTPKQLLNLCGDKTMIQETVSRVSALIPAENVSVVTNALQADAVHKQLPDIGNVFVEPFGRNTAPCIGLAAIYLKKKDPDAVMVVLPADHVINKKSAFLHILSEAEKFLEKQGDALITLGIPPSMPHTGYGYINSGEIINTSEEVSFYNVSGFTEKPDMETAKGFLEEGSYYWNSGTFIWKVSTILTMIETYIPELYNSLIKFEKSIGTDKEKDALEDLYHNVPSVSVDVGIMEKSNKTVMISADIGWGDVGSWSAMDALYPKDKSGNICVGEHIALNSEGCMVFSPKKPVAFVGLKDVVVVETDDALLVCNKNCTEDVKIVTEILKEKGMDKLL